MRPKTFALLAVCTALTAVESQAAVLFDIQGGGVVPTFSYGTAPADNNVINAAGVSPTGSTVIDPTAAGGVAGGAGSPWVGSVAGSTAVLSVSGLNAGQQYVISWQYIGSEAVNINTFSVNAPANNTSTIALGDISPFSGDNRNNNCCTWGLSGTNPQVVSNLGAVLYNGTNTISTPGFTLKDVATGATVSNTAVAGSNPAPNGGAANLIFAYLTPHVGSPQDSIVWDLTTTQTNTVVFGFNDDGASADDHDDWMGIASLLGGGSCNCDAVATPIPGTLPLLGSAIVGAFGLLGWRKKRKSVINPQLRVV
jgi:hypothetical protein